MLQEKAPQKLVSFTNSKSDLDKISAEIKDGWCIVSLVENDSCYIGVMEKTPNIPLVPDENVEVYIPARKKIKISF